MQKFSIGPDELRTLKRITQSHYLMNNKKNLKKNSSEEPSKIFRRSLYAIRNIKKNEKFDPTNIGCYRPKDGIGSEYYFKIIGKKSKINIKKKIVF